MNSVEHLSINTNSKSEKVKWRPTIRLYLILMNLVLLCLLFPSASIVFLKKEAAFRDTQLSRSIMEMSENLETKAASIARSIALSASQALAGYEITFLISMIEEVVDNDPELIYCMIMDPSGQVMVHNDQQQLGVRLVSAVDKRIIAMLANEFPAEKEGDSHSRRIKYIKRQVRVNNKDLSIMEAVIPVYSGSMLIGALRCGFSLEVLNTRIKLARTEWAEKMKEFKLYFLSLTGIFFSIGVVVATLFTRSLVNSINVLNIGVQRVSEGDLVYTINQNDLVCKEFADLSNAMNIMTLKLRHSYQKLDEYSKSLEEKVEERTRELREAQANLMQQAHEAGMAEMAVGILHNIGNALPPVKVSVSKTIKTLRESPLHNQLMVDSLGRLKKELEISGIAADKEKEKLLKILELLPMSLREEYGRVIKELDLIKDKHDHIESIISLQMRYARMFGDVEAIDLNHLVDDALQILDESIGKGNIIIEKHLERIPLVKIEQTKLMQVIVNLIKNGCEAMVDTPEGERRLIISTYIEEGIPGYIVMSVKDTGKGFNPEDANNLFKFGYTTKSKGSGIGLHSCANYLIANNGLIEANSEGEGKGAEFIIKLPLDYKE